MRTGVTFHLQIGLSGAAGGFFMKALPKPVIIPRLQARLSN
jgi:hypothetical protein